MDLYQPCPACQGEMGHHDLRCTGFGARHASAWQRRIPAMRWHRSLADKKVSGVCAALGRELVVSPNLIRAMFVAGLFCSFGIALAIYIFLWRVIPLEPWPYEPSFEMACEPIPIDVLTTPRTPSVNFALHDLFDWVHDKLFD